MLGPDLRQKLQSNIEFAQTLQELALNDKAQLSWMQPAVLVETVSRRAHAKT